MDNIFGFEFPWQTSSQPRVTLWQAHIAMEKIPHGRVYISWRNDNRVTP